MTQVIRNLPDQCAVHEYVPRTAVAHWPKMSDKSAIAFKRFIGRKAIQGKLHRLGNRIFEIGESELALCVYNHSRQF